MNQNFISVGFLRKKSAFHPQRLEILPKTFKKGIKRSSNEKFLKSSLFFTDYSPDSWMNAGAVAFNPQDNRFFQGDVTLKIPFEF